MKLLVVPPRTGIAWVRLGIQTFARQPLAFSGLFFMYWFSIVLLAMVPVVGLGFALVLVPAGALGFMVATRDAAEGRIALPSRLFAGFRQGRERTRVLLQLGVAHALIILVLVLGVSLLFPMPAQAPEDDPLLLFTPARLVATLVQLPVSILFCYAPALSHWHGVPATKALFFSVVALWRNLGAFVTFGLAWSAVVALAMGVLLVLAKAVGPLGGAFVAGPLLIAVASMMMASTYFTFRDSFTADPAPGTSQPLDGASP
ncbi:BPSS1780 family membrane protein [Ramlibacter algicola]|uniref:Uncharacterized protein n=1 Tax=Ramlibacter algicola TaxID=2795217 RepID=A0A934USS3_9BURK|nr:BPSS1780 family membrane protein [Ramlibacter algicola]MBK0394028.1 hypothetical protein [Ramlibacter algicola]